MEAGTLVGIMAAPLLGAAAIICAYRLSQTHRYAFLTDYLLFLGLAAAWGFALWTIPALLSVVGSGPTRGTAALRLPLVSKWFGFPFHLLQLYFLVLTLWGLIGQPVSRLFRRVFAAGATLVLIALLAALVNVRWGGGKDLLRALHSGITSAYLLLQAVIFLWAAVRARRSAEPGRRATVAGFAWLYLAGFGTYYALTTWMTTSATMSGLIFAAYHWPPLAVLAVGLRRGRFAPAAPASAVGSQIWLDRFDLTDRERDIVGRLLDGQSNRQMADELFLSHQTVKNYVSRIYRKLNVSSRVELIVAMRRDSDGSA